MIETNNKKLLVFAPYYPPHIGGVEQYAEALNSALADSNYNLTIFTPQLPIESDAQEQTNQAIKIIRFPAFEIISNYPLPKFWLPSFWRLWNSLNKNDFDLIISHTRFFFTSLLALFFAKTKKTKWIHIEHGSDFVQTKNVLISFFAKTYDLTIGKIILSQANHVVAISQSVQKFVLHLQPKAVCTCIYRGFDSAKIKQILSFEKKPDVSELIYIGRLISGKGVLNLLQALKTLAGMDFHCTIIGDGPERKKLEQFIAENGLWQKVSFVGHKPWNDTVAFLKNSDIFINPSLSEGLPTTVVEAALCQKTIIATNVGGTNEIIKDNESGFLVEPCNSEQLAAKIKILLENKKLAAEFAQKAYAENSAKFSWQKCVAELEKIIVSLK